jgi:hypothetical protein
MKIRRFAILALVLAVGTATAGIVTVDFGSVSGTNDITLPNSLPLNGLTFQYVPQTSTDAAQIDNTGVYGSTLGPLNLYFDFPAVGLTFTYDVAGLNTINSCSGGVCLDVLFGSSDIQFASPAGTASIGSFAGPPATPFSLVTLYFSTTTDGINNDIVNFDIYSASYDSTVPEPATFALFGAALLGLCGRKLLKRRS